MITTDVKFMRKYLYSMGEKYSTFRGKGRISLDGESIVVDGKRIIQPMILRGAIILFSAVSIALLFKLASLFLFVLLLMYYLLQFILLEKERITLTWSQIKNYEVDDRRKIIAFSIENNSKCSPVVFTAANFTEIANMFREKIQDRARTSRGWTAVEQRYDEQVNSMAKAVDRWFEGKKR